MTEADLVRHVAGTHGAGDVTTVVEHIRQVEHESIANHSIRTYIYAAEIADLERARADEPLDATALLHACLLHDVGTRAAGDGELRFEVEGGDAAAVWLSERGFDAPHRRRVWEAIALHTTPHVAERWGGVVRYTRLGVRTDFGDDNVPASRRAEVEAAYPRLDVERYLSRAVVEQCLRDPRKAPKNSWPGNLLRERLAHPDEPDSQLRAF